LPDASAAADTPDVDLGSGTATGASTGTGGPAGAADVDAGLRAVPSAWDELPGGPRFGTMVHAVIEHLPDAPDATSLAAVVAEHSFRGPPTDAPSLTAALLVSMATPLGPLADGAALNGIALSDRLAELDFELPLAGGDKPSAAQPLLSHLVPLWREHCPTGPLAAYADALADLEPAPLRGYLAGSIDTVLRVGGQAAPRYLVVDYKTNRLGGFGTPLTAWDYRPEALRDAMIEAHYPLQALLYQVALHRFLRWRQPHYDPQVHLGGVLYLFLRGMSGPGVACADGSPPGVFAWQPAPALVTSTSDLLAGRRDRRGPRAGVRRDDRAVGRRAC
jgi:exodeoxyribonuclease V beta subunit